MKKICLFLVALFASIFSVSAGKIVADSIKSEILNSYVKFNVYLPSGYDVKNSLYPVVYLLHGHGDDCDGWIRKGNMQIVADELIESGEAKEMIIVMPTAGVDGDNTDVMAGYFNMPGWDYEDFFFSEFIPFVESKYRGIGDKYHRAVMGLSMGGGGSTVYCQRHPDMFSSCYAMSPWLYEKPCTDKSHKVYYTRNAVAEHNAVEFLNKASEDVKKQLRTVAWFFDCGDDDFLLEQTFAMHMKMRQMKIKDQLTVRNGVHNWEYWHFSLRVALPFASRNFN